MIWDTAWHGSRAESLREGLSFYSELVSHGVLNVVIRRELI